MDEKRIDQKKDEGYMDNTTAMIKGNYLNKRKLKMIKTEKKP